MSSSGILFHSLSDYLTKSFSSKFTVIVSGKVDIPGVFGVRLGGAATFSESTSGIGASITQIGFVASHDIAPRTAVRLFSQGIQSIADQFDAVIISQETFDTWQDLSGGKLIGGTGFGIEVLKGDISTQNGLTLKTGAGFGGFGISSYFDLQTDDFLGGGVYIGPTIGAEIGVSNSFGVTAIDIEQIEFAIKSQFSETGLGKTKILGDDSVETITSKEELKSAIAKDDNIVRNPNPLCFAAGTSVNLPLGERRPIESLAIGDEVLAFDPEAEGGRGGLVAKRVTQVHASEGREVMDFHGVTVTPGHVFLTDNGRFEALVDILERDGVVVDADGKTLRARMGWEAGSARDRVVRVGYHENGEVKVTAMRAGTLITEHEGRLISIDEAMALDGFRPASPEEHGAEAEGRYINAEGDLKSFFWRWSPPHARLIAGHRASYRHEAIEVTAGMAGAPLAEDARELVH